MALAGLTSSRGVFSLGSIDLHPTFDRRPVLPLPRWIECIILHDSHNNLGRLVLFIISVIFFLLYLDLLFL